MRLPSKKSLSENKISQWLIKQANSNWFAALLFGVIVWGVALIPTFIYFGIRWLIDPIGFWQEFAIVVICGLVMGWFQVILIIAAVFLTLMIIAEDF